MPLKIRCPHCQTILRAEDDTAGEQKRCPACGQTFTVPLPGRVPVGNAATTVASICPRCGADLAPATTICRRCHSDVVSGKRLPLTRRLRLISLKARMIGVSIAAGVGLLAYVGQQVYWARFHRSELAATTFRPVPATPFAAEEWAARLLGASGGAERRAARERLLLASAHAAPQVAAAVATALEGALSGGKQDVVSVGNQLAAIAVLGRAAAHNSEAANRHAPVLERAEQTAALREAAWVVRAMLGDGAVLEDLRKIWLRELRRLMFLTRLAQLTGDGEAAATAAVIRRTRSKVNRIAAGLHRLKQDDEVAVLGGLMTAVWESWTWLGDSRGALVAAELFELAKPAPGERDQGADGFEQQKRAIRRARDALSSVGQRGSPPARAAAGLVMAYRAPAYRAARRRIADKLPAVLPDCEPRVQQRITWALARLTGRQFGQATKQSLPAEIRRADVEAVLRWARSGGANHLPALTTPADAYPTPPRLEYRAVLPGRQLERELLRQFKQGWPAATTALDQWIEAGIGWTPRLLETLDPGQRTPDYPALAATMVIVAEYNQQGVRDRLALWRAASEQPPWVRQLAYMALGALDARTASWPSGWPAGLDLGPPRRLAGGQPGWDHFGRILAAGGRRMVERLESYTPAPLPPAVLDRLLAAAEHAAARRARPGGP